MLTARQKRVLALIIQQYNETDEPIGSKSLLKNSDLQVSSATIRNDMAALEDAGFLKKLHTSSGRSPSLKGYRYYINHLIDLSNKLEVSEIEEDIFSTISQESNQEPIQRAKMMSELISSVTRHTSFVLGQPNVDHYFERFRLVKLDTYRFMGIMMTKNGEVSHQLFTIEQEISSENIQVINEILNHELQGLTLVEAKQRLKLTLPFVLQRHIGFQYDFSSLVEKMNVQLMGRDYFINGKEFLYHLINASMSPKGIADLMALVDGDNMTYQLLEDLQLGIDVLFGNDVSPNELDHINVLAGTYFYDNQRITIGVIGPLSMKYVKLIPLINKAIQQLSE